MPERVHDVLELPDGEAVESDRGSEAAQREIAEMKTRRIHYKPRVGEVNIEQQGQHIASA